MKTYDQITNVKSIDGTNHGWRSQQQREDLRLPGEEKPSACGINMARKR